MILVTGATGVVGSELVKQLAAGGHHVRAMMHSPRSPLFSQGVEVIVGDFSKPSTLAAALEGVQQVFLLTTGEQLALYDATFVAAAQQAGIAHIVKLSVMGVGHGAKDPITLWHTAGETAIQRSGLAWTFVRSGGFMSNALMWANSITTQGGVYAPFGDDKVAIVDPHDIAAVAACALTRPGHAGKVYELSGPEALSAQEQVQRISEAIEKPLRFTDIPPAVAEDHIRAAGASAILADAVVQSLAQAQQSFAAEVLATVAEVTGREPRSFTQWLAEHLMAFQG